MKVQLFQAAHLGGKDYSVGIHEIPDAHLKTKFALKLIKAGHLIDATEKVIKAVSRAEQQRKLEETLHKAPFQVTLPKAVDAPKPVSKINQKDLMLDQTEDDEDETQDWDGPKASNDEESFDDDESIDDEEPEDEEPEIKKEKKPKKPGPPKKPTSKTKNKRG